MFRILIIEDEADVRANVTEVLQLEGMDTIEAPNGAVGIQLAVEQQPDLILCDIRMPEVDGFGVLEYVRQDQQLAHIPFIFMSARTNNFDMSSVMEMGADAFLSKPFKIDDLLGIIRGLLN